MLNVIIRFTIVYVLLTLMMKLLGKRQIGQMQQSEFLTTLLLSELACAVVTDVQIPLLFGVLPVLFMICLEVIISFGSVKLPKLKRAFDEPAVYLIQGGKLDQKALLENRITLDELLSLLRLADSPDISMVRDAILESNGQLSVTRMDKEDASLAVVEDGVINEKALNKIGRDKAWLTALLAKEGKEVGSVFLACATGNGLCYLAMKEKT